MIIYQIRYLLNVIGFSNQAFSVINRTRELFSGNRASPWDIFNFITLITSYNIIFCIMCANFIYKMENSYRNHNTKNIIETHNIYMVIWTQFGHSYIIVDSR